MKRLLFAFTIFMMVACSTAPQLSQEEREAYRFADKLIKKMTLHEKIGQLQQLVTKNGTVTGPGGGAENVEESIRNGSVGSFLSIKTTEQMSRFMFIDRYLPPYRAAIEVGAVTAMSSFNDFEGVPASGNRWLMHDLLREELGFERITLAAGESKVVEFEVPTSDLAYCHGDLSVKTDAGDFLV